MILSILVSQVVEWFHFLIFWQVDVSSLSLDSGWRFFHLTSLFLKPVESFHKFWKFFLSSFVEVFINTIVHNILGDILFLLKTHNSSNCFVFWLEDGKVLVGIILLLILARVWTDVNRIRISLDVFIVWITNTQFLKLNIFLLVVWKLNFFSSKHLCCKNLFLKHRFCNNKWNAYENYNNCCNDDERTWNIFLIFHTFNQFIFFIGWTFSIFG